MKGILKEVILISDDERFNRQIRRELSRKDNSFNLQIISSINNTLPSSVKIYDLIVIHSRKKLMDAHRDFIEAASGKPVIISGRFERRKAERNFSTSNVLEFPDGIKNFHVLSGIIQTIFKNNEQNDAIRRRDEIFEAVNFAAEMFLVQQDWKPYIEDILARLGKATDSDRVFIFKTRMKNLKMEKAEIFSEWARDGVKPQSEMASDVFDINQEIGAASWFKTLNQGKSFQAKVTELPKEEQKFLDHLGVVSFIVMPVVVDKALWGFMGFDQCRNSKNWAPVEIEALNTAASIFGAAVSRLINQQKLMYLATHDFLTNLPNRLLFEDRFSLAKARADRSKDKLAVISIDLDKFKQVNDTWGHPVGDVVLIEIAKRLNNAVRTSDTCARIGGDEFAVIAEGIHNRSDVMRVMQKLDESFIEPILHEKQEIYVRASMAAALFPDTGNDLQELMKAADKALYEVKSSHIRYKIYRKDQYSLLEN